MFDARMQRVQEPRRLWLGSTNHSIGHAIPLMSFDKFRMSAMVRNSEHLIA